jgi:hypothetical protein
MKPYSIADLHEMDRVCHLLTSERTTQRIDGEMGRKRMLKRLDQETLEAMYAELKAAGRIGI